MLRVVRDEVFPHFRTLSGNGARPRDENGNGRKNTFSEYMKDAQRTWDLLAAAVQEYDVVMDKVAARMDAF